MQFTFSVLVPLAIALFTTAAAMRSFPPTSQREHTQGTLLSAAIGLFVFSLVSKLIESFFPEGMPLVQAIRELARSLAFLALVGSLYFLDIKDPGG